MRERDLRFLLAFLGGGGVVKSADEVAYGPTANSSSCRNILCVGVAYRMGVVGVAVGC